MSRITITFDDLPIIEQLGFEAGNLSGRAEITIHDEGEWTVGAIFLDAARRVAPSEGLFVRGEIEVEFDPKSPSWLYRAIWGQLTNGRFRRQIEKVVAAEFEQLIPPEAPQRRVIEAVA